MTKELWINLPVKNVEKSREFFTTIGFSLNEKYGNSDHSASLEIGEKNFIVMLFEEEIFKGFTKNELPNGKQTTEVLFSFDAENREAVDETASKVFDAGGTIFSEPAEINGWMYGFGFADPDGHRWNMVFMDFSKMPQ